MAATGSSSMRRAKVRDLGTTRLPAHSVWAWARRRAGAARTSATATNGGNVDAKPRRRGRIAIIGGPPDRTERGWVDRSAAGADRSIDRVRPEGILRPRRRARY